ncbi:hypothetical protein KJ633_08575 [bacterium]|nr:hypothetical protein [bacterium]
MKTFVSYWPVLFIILIWALPKCNYPKLRFYLLMFVISLASVFNLSLPHYYFIIIPFLAIIASVAIDHTDNQLHKYLTSKTLFNKFYDTKDQTVFTMILLSFVVLTLIFPVKEQFTKSPKNLSVWNYNHALYIDSAIIAEKLKKITKSSDRVFIAGSHPEILYYSDRLSSTRFMITYPLSHLNTPKKTDYQKEVIESLKKSPPEVIVIPRCDNYTFLDIKGPNLLANFLINLIDDQYVLIGGFVKKNNCFPIKIFSVTNDRYNYMGKILDTNIDLKEDNKTDNEDDGYWQEPIAPENIEKASFLLFKKK